MTLNYETRIFPSSRRSQWDKNAVKDLFNTEILRKAQNDNYYFLNFGY